MPWNFDKIAKHVVHSIQDNCTIDGDFDKSAQFKVIVTVSWRFFDTFYLTFYNIDFDFSSRKFTIFSRVFR